MDLLQHKLERLKQDDLKEFYHNYNATNQDIARQRPNYLEGRIAEGIIDAAFEACGDGLQNLESIKLRTTENLPTCDNDASTGGLLRHLATSTTLKEFTMIGKYIPHRDIYLQSLQQNSSSSLQKLCIYCRNPPFREICQFLCKTKTLRHLELCGNHIQMNSIRTCVQLVETTAFLDALAANSSLESLELSLLDFQQGPGGRLDPMIWKPRDSKSCLTRLIFQDVKFTTCGRQQATTALDVMLLMFGTNLQILKIDETNVQLREVNQSVGGIALSSSTIHPQPPRAIGPKMISKGMASLKSFSHLHCHVSYVRIYYRRLLESHPDLEELEFGFPPSSFLNLRPEPLLWPFAEIGQGLANRTTDAVVKSLAFTSPISPTQLQRLVEPITGALARKPLVIENLSLKFNREETNFPELLRQILVDPSSTNIIITQQLTLDFDELTNEICNDLWMALRQNTSVQSLVLKGHGADRDIQRLAAFGALVQGMSQLSLQELTLDEGMRESLFGLKFLIGFPLDEEKEAPTTSLRRLTLSQMVFRTRAMVQYLAKFLAHSNSFLRQVHLDKCRMESNDAMALFQALTTSSCVLESFEFTRDGGFTTNEAGFIAEILPNMARSLKRLRLNGLKRIPFQDVSDIKQQYLNAMDQNTSLEYLEMDLEQDGLTFQYMVRYFGLRNQVDSMLRREDLLSRKNGGEIVAAPASSSREWLSLLAKCLDSESGCFAAVFYLLSRKLDIFQHWAR